MVRRKSGVRTGVEEPGALARLEGEAEAQASEIYQENHELLKIYVDKLTSTGIARGLLGPRESSRIWSRHILNCAALCEVLPQGTDVIDVGSGAGLPGIVVAIARPDLRITLLEPMLRRWRFLGETVDQLGLTDRVTVSRGRAEDCSTTYEVVTARAVARLTKLLGWTTPLFHPNGRLLALKGDSVQEEIAEAADLLEASGLIAEVMHVRAHPKAEATNVVKVTRARTGQPG
ncbi:16S rRNA (guanine(527)-N(7))-methyltransferase RsmG [uncultured Propionibacterium sp.]|uniref:16S rRNA (guanine(527)-N(7))-methyltransferase RsmG n=1 Tax=uncultured Propionibacterium sp. TaxID=218066 RepID=UPI0029309C06|nr:16S rRNA (guanine(527)-N(7))-methyltransferase RsmG [uncultured Propionibacterium sp.]